MEELRALMKQGNC